jgi:hypothetical protein
VVAGREGRCAGEDDHGGRGQRDELSLAENPHVGIAPFICRGLFAAAGSSCRAKTGLIIESETCFTHCGLD